MSGKFLVRLPVFQLDDGVRALLIYAKMHPLSPGTVQTVLHRVDGKQVSMDMDMGRAMRAQRNGPFVVLAEADNAGGNIRPGSIIGLDGQPLTRG